MNGGLWSDSSPIVLLSIRNANQTDLHWSRFQKDSLCKLQWLKFVNSLSSTIRHYILWLQVEGSSIYILRLTLKLGHQGWGCLIRKESAWIQFFRFKNTVRPHSKPQNPYSLPTDSIDSPHLHFQRCRQGRTIDGRYCECEWKLRLLQSTLWKGMLWFCASASRW